MPLCGREFQPSLTLILPLAWLLQRRAPELRASIPSPHKSRARRIPFYHNLEKNRLKKNFPFPLAENPIFHYELKIKLENI